jgi:hypothetical protein
MRSSRVVAAKAAQVSRAKIQHCAQMGGRLLAGNTSNSGAQWEENAFCPQA